MENTKTLNVISTPNIEGNIGSCEVKSTQFSHSFWKSETIAVNSCTGQIVAQNIYLDPLAFIVMGFVGIVALMVGVGAMATISESGRGSGARTF